MDGGNLYMGRRGKQDMGKPNSHVESSEEYCYDDESGEIMK